MPDEEGVAIDSPVCEGSSAEAPVSAANTGAQVQRPPVRS